MRIIVKRHKASGHEETNLVIDYHTTSEEDIKFLASLYVQHRVEEELKRYEYKLPEQITVRAGDYIHQETFVAKPINLPKHTNDKVVKESKAAKQLREAMEGLSKEEVAALFGSM